MSADEKSRRPSAHTEREARRLGWYRGCAITWREFLEQYPYGLDALAKDRGSMSHAA
jgi:hypothetical protein